MTSSVRQRRIWCVCGLAFAVWGLTYRINVVTRCGLTAWELLYIANWIIVALASAVALWRLRRQSGSEVTRLVSPLVRLLLAVPLALSFAVGLSLGGLDAWSIVGFAITGTAVVAAISERWRPRGMEARGARRTS